LSFPAFDFDAFFFARTGIDPRIKSEGHASLENAMAGALRVKTR
jgi:hypothetical protein